MVICLDRGADCLHVVQLMPLPSPYPSSLLSFKSRLVLPFWYRLTQVVPETRSFNGCCVVVILVILRCGILMCKTIGKCDASKSDIVTM